MWIDIIVYVFLLTLLLGLTRVRSTQRVILKYGGSVLPGHVLSTRGGINTRVGLLNSPTLTTGDGLHLYNVRSVHTRGMHYAIDIIYLDETNRILKFLKAVPPGKTKLSGPKGTQSILELGEGTVDALLPQIKLYSHLEVQPWTIT